MADSILKCLEFFDLQGNLESRVLHYHLEYAAHSKVFTADVHVNEMTDPTDLDECRTIANAKIAIQKSRWIDTLANSPSEDEIADLNGSVTL